MTPFRDRPADHDADTLAQLAAALIVENHTHHLAVQARRARIHQTTQWWTLLPKAAVLEPTGRWRRADRP
jgi:hypothetical protein